MNLIQVGCRVLNLDHLIYAEESSSDEGRLNVTRGRVIVLTGQEAAELRAMLTSRPHVRRATVLPPHR
jgi:hypothetical protein